MLNKFLFYNLKFSIEDPHSNVQISLSFWSMQNKDWKVEYGDWIDSDKLC